MQNEELNVDHHTPGNQQPSVHEENVYEITTPHPWKKAHSLKAKAQSRAFHPSHGKERGTSLSTRTHMRVHTRASVTV